MKVVKEIILETVNRGLQMFTVSVDNKGRFFAHEIGNLTQWAKVFTPNDPQAQRVAHRLNPTVRRANQYGAFLKPKAMTSVEDCMQLIYRQADSHVQYF